MQPGNPGPDDPYGQQQPPQYGQQPPYPNQPGPPPGGFGAPTGQNNTLGLVSMILGIAAIPLLCCFYLGILLGIGALVTGFMGKKNAEQGLASNRGQAMTGIICGGIAVGLGVVLIVLSVVLNVVDLPTNPGN